ncbi:MAG: DUF5668 domain-containing protein [Acidaminobacteraceae bacterium]
MNSDDQGFDGESFEKKENQNNHNQSHDGNNRLVGLVLIGVGVLWLVSKFTDFNIFSFSALWQLWPLLFVVAGISILFKNNKYVGKIAWIVFLAVVIFFSNTNLKPIDTGIPQLNDIQTKVIEKVNSKINMEFDFGEEITFNDKNYNNFVKSNRLESDMLVKAESKDSKDYFELSDVDMENEKLVVNLNSATLNLKGSDQNKLVSTYDYVDVFEKLDNELGFYVITKEKYQNTEKKLSKDLEIELSNKVEWDAQINAGAINGELDFSDVKLANVEVNSGASSYEVKLPSDDFNLDFNGGASSVAFDLPEDLGVHLKVNGMLISKNINEDDFYKEDGEYYSNNYKDAKYKANIEINIATGEVDVRVK